MGGSLWPGFATLANPKLEKAEDERKGNEDIDNKTLLLSLTQMNQRTKSKTN